MTEAERTQVRAEERKRLSSIMSHEEAKGREDLARHFALDTDLSVEAAVFALKAAGKAAPSMSAFEARMNGTRNPNVGPDGSTRNEDDPDAVGSSIVAVFRGHRQQRGGPRG